MSGEAKKSTTEVLLGMCVATKEVSQGEADAILAYWKTTAHQGMGERSKALKSHLESKFPARANAIWTSMTKIQIASMKSTKESAPQKAQDNPVDELLRPGEGHASHVSQQSENTGVVSQELMNNSTTKQEEETAKSAMYQSLASIPAKTGMSITLTRGASGGGTAVKVSSKVGLQDEISTEAAAAVAQKSKLPVPTELNWNQFNILDKDQLKEVVQTVNRKEGVTTNSDACKMLSMAIQQQACRILASGIVKNTWRHSKDSFDEFGRLMALGEKRGRDVYSMAFGPDTFNIISKSEVGSRQVCKSSGQEGVRVIIDEKQRYDQTITSGAGTKRKLDGGDGPGSNVPWWIEEARAEERGLTDWVGMAKLNVVDQVVGLGRGGASRRPRVTAPMETVPSAAVAPGALSSSSSGAVPGKGNTPGPGGQQPGGGAKGVDEKLKMYNKIKQECPIVMGMSSRDSNVLTKADIAGPVTDSVRAIFPSGHGYGVGLLGKGGIRAKLRVPNVNVNVV